MNKHTITVKERRGKRPDCITLQANIVDKKVKNSEVRQNRLICHNVSNWKNTINTTRTVID